MWIRIAACYPFGFNPEALAKYRVYPENSSSQSVLSGKRAKIVRKTISIVDSYLPKSVISTCKSERAEATAHALIRLIPRTLADRNPRAWFSLVWESMRFSLKPRALYYIFIFTVRYRLYLTA
jgi:hypothetical protein